MPNINLVTEKTSKKSFWTTEHGLLISIIILVLLLCLYGALLFINKKVSSQIESIQDQYETEYNKLLSSGDGNSIIDFENRSKVAQKLISQDKPISVLFSQIESSILPEVYLTSFEYNKDRNAVLLNCMGGNFNTMARQILSFKENKYFSQATSKAGYMSLKTNQLSFPINLKIK